MDKNMITMKEFGEMVIGELTVALGDDFTVSANMVQKNNGINLYGINICDHSSYVAPVIYLEQFYDRYQEGTEVGEIVENILRFYKEHKELPMDFSVENFKNWEYVKEHIDCKLINSANNKELLKGIPSVPFLDLAVVFQYIGVIADDSNYSILIKNDHLNMWDVTVEDLMQIVLAKKQEERPQILSMMEVLSGMVGECMLQDELEQVDDMMYVMTNESRTHGANTILCQEALEEFANKKGTDLVIIPSSIHELILVPMNKEVDMSYIAGMIAEVNTTQVGEDEVLSNHPYIYSRKDKAVIAA